MSNMSPLNSIYIPFVDARFSEKDLVNTFDYYNICNVSRVDFVDIPEKSGVCHAFVHVNNWHNSNNASMAFWEITNKGSFKFYYSQSQINSNAFWLLLPNKNPIPETKLNIHQLAVMMTEMEKKIVDQQYEMDIMRKRIEDLELSSIHVANKTASTSTRTHTYWDNHDDDDVLNTAFISDDEDDEHEVGEAGEVGEVEENYDDVPNLISCPDSDSDSDSDDDVASYYD